MKTVNTITAQKEAPEARAAKRELLHENKQALQFLHHTFRMDFQKPYFIAKGNGSFTFSKVRGLIEKAITGDYTACVLVKHKRRAWFERLHYVYFDSYDSRFSIERLSGSYNYDFDDYNMRGSFEEYRKTKTDYYFIIAQSAANLTPEKQPRGITPYERYASIGLKYGNSGDIIVTDYNNHRIKIPEWYGRKIDRPELDKSGYYRTDRVNDLKRRAAQLKKDREKAAVDAAAFDAKIAEMETGLEEARRHIIQIIQAAKARDDIKPLLGYSGKMELLDSAWAYLETFKEKAENKAFSNTKQALDIANQFACCISRI